MLKRKCSKPTMFKTTIKGYQGHLQGKIAETVRFQEVTMKSHQKCIGFTMKIVIFLTAFGFLLNFGCKPFENNKNQESKAKREQASIPKEPNRSVTKKKFSSMTIEEKIEDLMTRQRIYGEVQNKDASTLGEKGRISIIVKLSDESMKESWPQLMQVLSDMGDRRNLKYFIDYVESRFQGQISESTFWVILAANKGIVKLARLGSIPAMDYIERASFIFYWENSNIKWTVPNFKPYPLYGRALYSSLCIANLESLGETGTTRAKEILKSFIKNPETSCLFIPNSIDNIYNHRVTIMNSIARLLWIQKIGPDNYYGEETIKEYLNAITDPVLYPYGPDPKTVEGLDLSNDFPVSLEFIDDDRIINFIKLLNFQNNEKAFLRIRNFLVSGYRGELTKAKFRAIKEGFILLSNLSAHGDQKSLDFLSEGVNINYWAALNERGLINWTYGEKTAMDKYDLLTRYSITALGNTKTQLAKEKLIKTLEYDSNTKNQKELITNVINLINNKTAELIYDDE